MEKKFVVYMHTSPVSKRKMSESKKGSKNGMYGKKGGETQKNAVRKKYVSL